MNELSSAVWERYGRDTVSRNVFYLLIGGILSWGFVLTAYVAQATATWDPGIFMFLLVGLGIPILGIFMSLGSENPLISFVGFNFVVAGMAAILGPVLAHYAVSEPGLIEQAAAFTALVTAVMTVSGFLFPDFYKSIGGALFVALSSLVVVSILRLFIPAIQGVGIIDYLSAGIFSLYIGYDMWRASEIPSTLDNAVDVSVSLYLDILNLFLDILRIMSKKK